MNGLLFLIFLILALVLLVLGLLLGHTYLFRTDYFMEHVFPAHKPEAGLFFSKKKGDGDRLVLYYGARLFLLCLVAMALILMLRSFISN